MCTCLLLSYLLELNEWICGKEKNVNCLPVGKTYSCSVHCFSCKGEEPHWDDDAAFSCEVQITARPNALRSSFWLFVLIMLLRFAATILNYSHSKVSAGRLLEEGL